MGRIEIPEYKLWDIESIAQDFLNRHWDPAQHPVDIEMIVEDSLGMLIEVTEVEGFTVLGSICRRKSDGRFVIVVDESTFNRRYKIYRFTLAQEVSHFLLHRELLDAIRTVDDANHFRESLTEQQYRYLESDANRCAGAILMPQRAFCVVAHESYERWCKKVLQTGVGLSTSARFIQDHVVADLASAFDVNPKPARIRLQNHPIKLYKRIADSAARGLSYIAE